MIDLAGGFTPQASLKDAKLIRNFNREEVLRRYSLEKQAAENPAQVNLNPDLNLVTLIDSLRMVRAADLTPEDVRYFDVSNNLRLLEGITAADFTELSDEDSEASNYIVNDEDLIIVPEQFKKVYVFGQISTPGYYDYSEGKSFEYYLEKAGGLPETAKEMEETFIIKGDSRKWISVEDEYKIEAGDFIYVPRDIPRNFGFYLGRVSSIMGIIGTVATLVLLINQFGK